jgi:hypothetical protein
VINSQNSEILYFAISFFRLPRQSFSDGGWFRLPRGMPLSFFIPLG